MTARWRAAAISVVVASATLTTGARAQVAPDAERLRRAWADAGFGVEVRPPIFLEQGRVRPLGVVTTERGPSEGCLSVAVIGVRGAEFSLILDVVNAPDDERHIEHALAGVAAVTRCGADRSELANAAVEMRSPRGALAIVVARGALRAPAPHETLTDRLPTSTLTPDPGRARSSDDLTARVKHALDRAARDGATQSSRHVIRTSTSGAAHVLMSVRPGCHRFELLAPDTPGRQILNVDGELRDAAGGRLLARDRSEVPDARLEVCAGDLMPTVLAFGGAGGAAQVTLLDSIWPLGAGLPTAFGPRARASFARVLWQRRTPAPARPPVEVCLGGAGSAEFGVELEAGACYVAAVGATRGEPRRISLAVSGARVAASDEGGPIPDGAAVAFCAPETGRAAVRVDGRGGALGWLFALWEVSSVRTERGPHS